MTKRVEIDMDISKIAVIRAGTTGSGIAQVFAASGIEVLMTDIDDAAVNIVD